MIVADFIEESNFKYDDEILLEMTFKNGSKFINKFWIGDEIIHPGNACEINLENGDVKRCVIPEHNLRKL